MHTIKTRYSFDFLFGVDIIKIKEWCVVSCSKNMVLKLETIVEDYKKFQKESRELLGFVHTDKIYCKKEEND